MAHAARGCTLCCPKAVEYVAVFKLGCMDKEKMAMKEQFKIAGRQRVQR